MTLDTWKIKLAIVNFYSLLDLYSDLSSSLQVVSVIHSKEQQFFFFSDEKIRNMRPDINIIKRVSCLLKLVSENPSGRRLDVALIECVKN